MFNSSSSRPSIRRTQHHARLVSAVVAGVVVWSAGTVTATAEPATEPVNGSTAVEGCPEITDAVVRLYSAYFQREPDGGGYAYWTAEWSSANTNLPAMSAFFASSPEFTATYGGVDDTEFVELVYRNTFDRDGDPEGVAYWTGRLRTGLDRGTMLLLFSESPEYVAVTGTSPSFAGAFNWLPPLTQFMCTKNGTLWGDLLYGRHGSFDAVLFAAGDPAQATTTVHGSGNPWRIGEAANGRPASTRTRSIVFDSRSQIGTMIRFEAPDLDVLSHSIILSSAPGVRMFLVVPTPDPGAMR
jgi:hypothetical protein